MDLETLERRSLRSVSVAQGYPGYYEVYGDDDPNVIAIAVNPADSTFTLDGVTYGGVAYISVFGNAGDDTISVGVGGSIGTSVHGGPGDDNVAVSGGGAIWGDSGNDTLRITDSPRGELYGGPGDDKLYIVGACADAQINGEQGADLIDARDSTYGVFAFGDQGADTLFGSNADDQLYGGSGTDLVFGNGGNDVFYAADLEHDRVIGGAGIDVAYVDYGDGVWGVEYVFYV